jgi:hypothetical protein
MIPFQHLLRCRTLVPRGTEGSAPRGRGNARAGRQWPILYAELSKYFFEGQWGEHRIFGEEGLYFTGRNT